MRQALRLAVACAAVTISQAQPVEFDLGAPVNGFGLNQANESPPTGSPALGGETVDFAAPLNPMQYYSDTQRLELHFGWGNDPSLEYVHDSNATGVNLLGDEAGIHIHGPIDGSGTIGILYDLVGLAAGAPSGEGYFDPNGNGRTGAIDLTVQLVNNANSSTRSIADQQADLLGNLWYINIHSAVHPGGEIRGQLLNAVPEPEHYAALAGFALLGFAGYRRFKMARA